MPIADFAAYVTKEETPSSEVYFHKAPSSSSTGRLSSAWTASTLGVAGPATARACDRTTLGALEGLGEPTGTLRVVGAELSVTASSWVILCDRLADQGGLSGIVTGAQTTNLPTAALTRHTSGVGVRMALEIYTAVGATATTASVSYTNQDGTSGRTSPASTFGASGNNNAYRFITLPFEGTDTGVRSVESVTLAASTATVGNFGVVLYRPLAWFSLADPGAAPHRFNLVDGPGGMLTDVHPQACLFWLLIQSATTNAFAGVVKLSED